MLGTSSTIAFDPDKPFRLVIDVGSKLIIFGRHWGHCSDCIGQSH